MNPHLHSWSISADDFPADSYASDQLEFLLGYAVLAPSTHNSQPWLFRINAMDVELFADTRRALPVMDPQGRELVISCGAALLNLRVAAEYFGHQYKVEILPDSQEGNLLARLQLGLSGETSSEDIILFHEITRRHTNRGSFRPDPPPEALLADLAREAEQAEAWLKVLDGDEIRHAVADLVAEADHIQWSDKAFRDELSAWVRTKPEISSDGLPIPTLGMKNWLAFAAPLLIRTFNRGDGQAARDRDIANHSPVLAVLGTASDDPASWLAAGQALQRVLLRARAEDVWASFLNQPIELPDLRSRLNELMGAPGQPQILLRLGYGQPVSPTPRRSVRENLMMQPTTRDGR